MLHGLLNQVLSLSPLKNFLQCSANFLSSNCSANIPRIALYAPPLLYSSLTVLSLNTLSSVETPRLGLSPLTPSFVATLSGRCLGPEERNTAGLVHLSRSTFLNIIYCLILISSFYVCPCTNRLVHNSIVYRGALLCLRTTFSFLRLVSLWS